MPKSLYDNVKCDNQLNLRKEYELEIPRPKCGKSCLDPPFSTGPIFIIFASIEIIFTKLSPTYTILILEYMRLILPQSLIDEYLVTISKTLEMYTENVDDYQLGLVICVLINSYKLVSFFIFFTMFLPFVLKILFMTINALLLLLLKTVFITQIEKEDIDTTPQIS